MQRQQTSTGKWFDLFVFAVIENTGWSQVKDCSFVKEFRNKGVICTSWHGATHPSGPNYRAMLSGQTWSNNEFDGVARDNIAKHVGHAVFAFRGAPAQRHDPFWDMNPAEGLARITDFDPALIRPITYLGMDDANNAHSGPLAVCDQNIMDAIKLYEQLTAAAPDCRVLLCVTTDEAFGPEYPTNHVFTGFMGAGVKPGTTIDSAMSHYSLARFLADNWGVALPPEAHPDCARYAGQSLLEQK